MSYCTFKNDNNVHILLLPHQFSNTFARRDNHEILFRRINTFLMNNNIINGNIIDLGAWIGDNSIPWAKHEKGHIYAIDPSPDNCKFIRDMCALNTIKNVTTLQYAISDTQELISTNDNINHCSFVYQSPGTTGATKLQAVSLDFLFEQQQIEKIGYIHLDVEGMEFKVLKGSDTLINTCRPIITFEQHLEIDNYNDILEYLNQRNYKVFLINEILPGCRHDCRNSIAFPNEIYNSTLIDSIHSYIGGPHLIAK